MDNHKRTEMPEDFVPIAAEKGPIEHLLFVALTISINYQRDAVALWRSAQKTYQRNQKEMQSYGKR